ncbi:hypothetical protein B0H16DRAFT_1713844 [Mycena metata]|uniref:Uncharacterized protein n=1 Tax=Mycena metata TaxID=1033252 RepID=A0AAD7K1V8_9AGAR|nr:hypothetical protein B0H16DRAFT_1713844 [Mycena metata]
MRRNRGPPPAAPPASVAACSLHPARESRSRLRPPSSTASAAACIQLVHVPAVGRLPHLHLHLHAHHGPSACRDTRHQDNAASVEPARDVLIRPRTSSPVSTPTSRSTPRVRPRQPDATSRRFAQNRDTVLCLHIPSHAHCLPRRKDYRPYSILPTAAAERR